MAARAVVIEKTDRPAGAPIRPNGHAEMITCRPALPLECLLWFPTFVPERSC